MLSRAWSEAEQVESGGRAAFRCRRPCVEPRVERSGASGVGRASSRHEAWRSGSRFRGWETSLRSSPLNPLFQRYALERGLHPPPRRTAWVARSRPRAGPAPSPPEMLRRDVTNRRPSASRHEWEPAAARPSPSSPRRRAARSCSIRAGVRAPGRGDRSCRCCDATSRTAGLLGRFSLDRQLPPHAPAPTDRPRLSLPVAQLEPSSSAGEGSCDARCSMQALPPATEAG